jgi:hypothetical protein
MSELLCHKCGAILAPGEGDFYVVRIEAVADPTPPNIPAEQIEDADFQAEYQRILRQLEDLSETEALDQVYRKLTIHLCGRCYREWIEDPTG